jgi:processive 1,2-diacylglycerol beta-glucosyltransferase
MIQVYDNDTGVEIGQISEPQLQFLIDQLEEESEKDQDYWINKETLDAFEEEGADPALLAMLRGALGDREDMEIRWERK